jgi:hypothetical protein
MQLFVVQNLFTSTQQFESSILSHRRIYGISKPSAEVTGSLNQEIGKRGMGWDGWAWPDSARRRCGCVGEPGI